MAKQVAPLYPRGTECIQPSPLFRFLSVIYYILRHAISTERKPNLRTMYLKFRWGLSYEEVESEARERLPWRYFCHLSLMEPFPDATTLIMLNQRFGKKRIGDLNRHLVKSW